MNELRERLDHVEALAKEDEQYSRMLREMAILEERYFSVLSRLSYEQQDIISDFVSQCEGISWRMLELACENITLPE